MRGGVRKSIAIVMSYYTSSSSFFTREDLFSVRPPLANDTFTIETEALPATERGQSVQ